MKNICRIVICFFLLLCPVMASSIDSSVTVGTLQKSNVVLQSSSGILETYKAYDSYYVAVSRLSNLGCSVNYTTDTGKIQATLSNTPILSSHTIPFDLVNKPFALYDKEVWIGNFRTHSIVSEGRVLVPLGALRELYSIAIDGTTYTLMPKQSTNILAHLDRIENHTTSSALVEVTDLYWSNGWITEKDTFTVDANGTLSRLLPDATPDKTYISTIVSSVTTSGSTYTNDNMYGQTNTSLFNAYTRIKNYGSLSDLGDPIDLNKILEVENTVNSMSLHSKTPYLVWTNIDSQRTYIFEGSNGNWQLIKHFICSTGRDRTPTPKGQFELTRKVPYFGVEKGYRCKNAFGFIGTTYLYHSLIFDKTGSYLLEGKGVLGQKASEGCIRFSVENSEWFYDNMVSGTKVWIN